MSRPSGTGRHPWISLLLSPLGALYGLVAGLRMQNAGFDAGIPVLCVGNYHAGGAGKTPLVLALAELLRELDETPVVLSRGYGGRLQGPIKVDPARHVAADVGDEPLMLALRLPVVVARDRVGGVALARSQGASVILMDDGFQNPAIAKDCSLIVIDGERGIGNGGVFPAGPLRAPLRQQLARTDALIVVGDGSAADAVAAAVAAQGRPVLRAQLTPDPATVARLAGRGVLAFAGIGDPARFFRTLRGSGIDVIAERAFPGSPSVLESRDRRAGRRGDARWVDHGHDRKGSGAAARRRRHSRLGARYRAVRGEAWVRGHGRLAEVRSRPAVPGAPEQVSAWQLALCLQHAGKMPLQHRARHGVGLLQVDAPIFQLVERYADIGHRAAHIGSRRDHPEITVEILDLRFAVSRRTEFIQHG